MHYGRKGMKWYQNIFTKDKTGSGKKGKSDKDDDDDQKKTGDSKSSSSSSSSGKKSAQDMSEAELMSSIRHLQLEKQYRDLERQRAAELDPPKTSKGKEFISDFVSRSAVPAIQEAGKAVMKDWLVKVGKKAMGLDGEQAEDAMGALEKEVKKLRLDKEKVEINEYLNKKKSGKKTAEEEEDEYINKLAKEARKKKLEKDLGINQDSDEPKSNASSSESKKDTESDDGFQDTINYYFSGGGKKKADTGAEYVKATVEPDNRTAKERYDQSNGPVYTVDFASSDTSSGRSFVNQWLLEDKSK